MATGRVCLKILPTTFLLLRPESDEERDHVLYVLLGQIQGFAKFQDLLFLPNLTFVYHVGWCRDGHVSFHTINGRKSVFRNLLSMTSSQTAAVPSLPDMVIP
jgi:hypothetical protein